MYGDDLLSQARAGDVSYYVYDGQGSVRSLTNQTGVQTDSYHYDAFGILLHSEGDTPNSYLYTGEQYDASLDQYYLRARYYDQNQGRFTQMDTWAGNHRFPMTLNKYIYVLSDPLFYSDPTGYVPSPYESNFGQAVDDYVCDEYRAWAMSPTTKCDAPIVHNYFGDFLKPDILDIQNKRYAEVKPLSISGIASGTTQMKAYDSAYGKFGLSREIGFFPAPTSVQGTEVYFFNSDGVIFYTDDDDERSNMRGVPLTSMSRKYRAYWTGRRSMYRNLTSPLSTYDKVVLSGVGAAMALQGARCKVRDYGCSSNDA
ncbi:RHS repeat-associated core domain-containing protein [Hahella chejuensis]|uniref:RHS repeat-associated core domain-containing protein n=1 Tax=Hahella chejuensis TaxID=158327 RepID=UPI001EE3EF51|nr:RHS repeat-associated core domain-containing protein [Hahella chejuensis]